MPKGRSSKLVFKPYNQDQDVLFAYSLQDLVPEKHPARLISKIIDQIDISEIINSYSGGGASRYSPKMLLKVIFFSYYNNVYSCRGIAQNVVESVPCMWLAAGQKPDYRTINAFRGGKLKNAIDNIFKQVTNLLIENHLVSLDTVFVDGTKVESVAGRYSFVWKKSVEKNENNLKEKIKVVLEEITESINQDNKTIDLTESSCEINSENLEKSIEKINQAIKEKKELANKTEKKAIKKVECTVVKLQKNVEKLKDYEEKSKILGDRNSYSKTDTDATFLRLKDGNLRPAYNVQISTENQCVLNYSIHQTAADTGTFVPHMEKFKELHDCSPAKTVADGAYGSMENWEYCANNDIDNYLKYNTFHQESKDSYKYDISKAENLYYNKQEDYFVCPMGQRMTNAGTKTVVTKNKYEYEVSMYVAQNCNGCPLRGACHKSKTNRKIDYNSKMKEHKKTARENLNSELGIELRKRRSYDVEPVFGDIKFNRRFHRFRMTGLEKANLEIGLLSTVHNLKKLHKHITRKMSDLFILFQNIQNLGLIMLYPSHKNRKLILFEFPINKFQSAA